MSIILKLIILASLSQSIISIIQPKGPTFRKYAVQCLEQLTDHGYAFLKSKTKYRDKFLLTYVITQNLTTPGYEIQTELLRNLYRKKQWQIEVLRSTRINFQSYSENCITDITFDHHSPERVRQPENCSRHHVINFKTSLYILVVDEYKTLFDKLKNISETLTFSRKALFVIYYTKGLTSVDVVINILDTMVMEAMIHMVLLAPRNLTHFGVYLRRMKNVENEQCFTQLEWKKSLYFYCSKGVLETNNANVFWKHLIKYFNGCYLRMHALPYAPFVLSNKTGIEIDIAKEVGRILNISFRIQLYPYPASSLGEKLENGSWTGFSQPIYEDWDIGIGNISPERNLLEDFTFSIGYHWVKIVFITPIAPLIPKWRILTVIFSPALWGICLTVIFGFATIFWIFKKPIEKSSFKGYQKCIEAAYQILIAHPVVHQPISKYTRVYFISLAVFAIIMSSVYTSSLIFYLQTPIRQHQIKTGKEIVSNNLVLGALKQYKPIFEVSRTQTAKILLKTYQTRDDVNDTYIHWLVKVANDKNMTTLAGKLFVKYLISINDPRFVDKHGQPKIYITPKSILIQQIAFMMRRDTLLEDPLNYIIQRFIIQGGVCEKIKKQYESKIFREDYTASENEPNDEDDDQDGTDPGVHPLTPSQLQAAFTIWLMGLLVACNSIIIEIIVTYIEKWLKKKHN